jgi:hypothetical protein
MSNRREGPSRADLIKQLQVTPRLVWGGLALMFLAAYFLHVQISDWRTKLENQLEEINGNIAITSQGNALETWQTRSQEASAARESWRAKIWAGPTPGIISANAQSTLTAIAGSAGLESIQVTVASDPVLVNSRNLLRFEVIAIANSQSFLTFLVELSTRKESIQISELNADISGKQNARIRISGYLPARITTTEGEAEQ